MATAVEKYFERVRLFTKTDIFRCYAELKGEDYNEKLYNKLDRRIQVVCNHFGKRLSNFFVDLSADNEMIDEGDYDVEINYEMVEVSKSLDDIIDKYISPVELSYSKEFTEEIEKGINPCFDAQCITVEQSDKEKYTQKFTIENVAIIVALMLDYDKPSIPFSLLDYKTTDIFHWIRKILDNAKKVIGYYNDRLKKEISRYVCDRDIKSSHKDINSERLHSKWEKEARNYIENVSIDIESEKNLLEEYKFLLERYIDYVLKKTYPSDMLCDLLTIFKELEGGFKYTLFVDELGEAAKKHFANICAECIEKINKIKNSPSILKSDKKRIDKINKRFEEFKSKYQPDQDS